MNWETVYTLPLEHTYSSLFAHTTYQTFTLCNLLYDLTNELGLLVKKNCQFESSPEKRKMMMVRTIQIIDPSAGDLRASEKYLQTLNLQSCLSTPNGSSMMPSTQHFSLN